MIYTASAHHLKEGCALLSWAVLMQSTFTGVLNVPLLSDFLRFEQSMFHATGSSMTGQQCMLVLALSYGFQIPSKKHTAHSLQNCSYKAFNIKHKLPVWLIFHCAVNPTLPNTQSYINFPHDATHLPRVANLKPTVYSGPSCTFFSLRIHRLNCK